MTQGGRCLLGLNGGSVSFGVCARCPVPGSEAGEWYRSQRPKDPDPLPGPRELAQNFGHAIVDWAKAGFKVADEDTANERRAVCQACEYWDPEACFHTGRCTKCGCGRAKWWLATSECPIRKWELTSTTPSGKEHLTERT